MKVDFLIRWLAGWAGLVGLLAQLNGNAFGPIRWLAGWPMWIAGPVSWLAGPLVQPNVAGTIKSGGYPDTMDTMFLGPWFFFTNMVGILGGKSLLFFSCHFTRQ